MNALKLLTFDINKTLIKVRHSVGYQYSKAASTFGIQADPEKVQSAFEKFYEKQKLKQPNYGESAGTTTELWWTEIIKETFSSLGHSDTSTLQQLGAKLFYDFQQPEYWDVYPEVENVLTYFNKKGMCLGVVSNFDERLISVLKNLHIDTYFSFILPSVYMKCQKPEIFQKALDLTKVQPSECLHIGDSVKNDFAARGIGINAYLLDRDGSIQKNNPHIDRDYFIKNLEELKTLVP